MIKSLRGRLLRLLVIKASPQILAGKELKYIIYNQYILRVPVSALYCFLYEYNLSFLQFYDNILIQCLLILYHIYIAPLT